jgi:hypothetical protein
MTVARKLNGRQRLWVVAAALSLIYAIYWATNKVATSPYVVDERVIAEFSSPACRYIVTVSSGFHLEQRLDFNDPCYHLYLYRDSYETAATTPEGYVEDLARQHREAVLIALSVGLVLWLAGVLLLYAAGAVTAWVRGGFGRTTEEERHNGAP